MADENPFSAPQAELGRSQHEGVIVDNDGQPLLVIRAKPTRLPTRCFHCNASDIQRQIVVRIHDPRARLMAFCSIFLGPFFFLCYFLLPSFPLRMSLCERHAHPERELRWIVRFLALGGVALMVVPLILNLWSVAVLFVALGVLMLVATALFAVLRPKPARATKFDGSYAWIKGAHPDFIASLKQPVRAEEVTGG